MAYRSRRVDCYSQSLDYRTTGGYLLAVIYIIAFIVGIGHFAHCIASSCEILTSVEFGAVSAGAYFNWLLYATLGNICGRVFIVSLLSYGQVRAS